MKTCQRHAWSLSGLVDLAISNNLISFRVLGACERLKPALMAVLFGISRPVTGALAGPFKVTGEPDTCNLQHILF